MPGDPALPNLSPEEHAELERLRQRHGELISIKTPAEAAEAREELRRLNARIKELIAKGSAFVIRG